MNRIWEIDALRGLAVILMIIYHLLFDLNLFGILDLNFNSGFWLYAGPSIGSLFIFIMGVSLTLNYLQHQRDKEPTSLFSKQLKRGLKIFAWGLLITLASYLFIPQTPIIFGILHLLGVTSILAYPFLKHKPSNILTFAIILLILGYLLPQYFTPNFPWLIWLGITPHDYSMADYYPLLPWFGVVLLGTFTGKTLYSHPKTLLPTTNYHTPFIYTLIKIGRHSLLIYLLHQPIILLILYLLIPEV